MLKKDNFKQNLKAFFKNISTHGFCCMYSYIFHGLPIWKNM